MNERTSKLPTRLSDEEFWTLSTRLSEKPGTFTHSDNLVSNERQVVHLTRMLRPGGGVYIGVGPEQNFTYVAALRPALAFIIDIREENLSLHLMYKALFEVSRDRADFLSRLFSRERPAGLTTRATVQDLFAAYQTVTRSRNLYDATARLLRDRLLETHGFHLSPHDLAWIEYALDAFYADGPDIHYGRLRPGDRAEPSYRVLMTAEDTAGRSRSYLASEEGFRFVQDLQARNLIVPIVGDFAGPTAIRRTGDYIRAADSVVTAFYGSNVQAYLNRSGVSAFCVSLATLPYDSRTWFITNTDMEPLARKLKACNGR